MYFLYVNDAPEGYIVEPFLNPQIRVFGHRNTFLLSDHEPWFTDISEVFPGVYKPWPPETILSGHILPKKVNMGHN